MHNYKELQNENQYLKEVIAKLMHKDSVDSSAKVLTKRSPLVERIHLMMQLFKGRNDVYALRWQSKSGSSGYTPACALEWQKPLCQKPLIKCSECQQRKLLPLTAEVLMEHIQGKKTVGVYPILQNNVCMFLAIDFDKGNWSEDVLAFSKTCRRLNIPYNIEKSRSGNGAHIWIFFATPIPAIEARKLGKLLLDRTKEINIGFKLDSFDRLFPNQDYLPKGGFGNLIALPLQGIPGRKGNSLFINENFIPYPDQWMYLSTLRKMTGNELTTILHSSHHHSDDVKEYPDKLPESVDLTLKNGIYLNKTALPKYLIDKILDMASFSNPNYFKAKNNRFSTKNIPRVIQCTDELENNIILPRGCLQEVLNLLISSSVKPNINNLQFSGEPIELKFHGTLSTQQDEAVKSILLHNQGILSATTGFGKTVLATSIIAERKVNTLVIVHRTMLIQQWIEKLSAFLNIPPTDIGQIGGGKNKITGFIDVATIQSLNYGGQLKSFISQYGQIIIDECHIISAITFESVLKKIRPQYILGLTATPRRQDNMHPIITMQCGPIRYQINAKSQAKVRPFIHRLIPRKTNFDTKKENFQEICEEIALNQDRNEKIFNDVLHSLDNGRSPIILTNRIKHLEILTKKFTGFAKNIIVLTGNMSKSDQRKELDKLSKIPNDEERLIIATGKYIGEGFDDARLDTLFLTMPISWKGTLQQYVGRLHRDYHSKQEVQVYDYIDANVSSLEKMYKKRFSGYKSIGYLDNEGKSVSEQMKLF